MTSVDVRPNMGLEAELEAYPTRLHDHDAHVLITRELVACTLGARKRPELRADLAGKVRHAAQVLRQAIESMRRTMCRRLCPRDCGSDCRDCR